MKKKKTEKLIEILLDRKKSRKDSNLFKRKKT